MKLNDLRDKDGATHSKKRLGRGIDRHRPIKWSLGPHGRRRFDRRHIPVQRFVRAGAGPHVDDRAGRAQRGVDVGGNPRVSAPLRRAARAAARRARGSA